MGCDFAYLKLKSTRTFSFANLTAKPAKKSSIPELELGLKRRFYRAAVQHLAMFVPWENFLSEVSGDINDIWERQKQILPQRLGAIAGNIQLLRRSAEDAKRDARQWAAECGEADPLADPSKPCPWVPRHAESAAFPVTTWDGCRLR